MVKTDATNFEDNSRTDLAVNYDVDPLFKLDHNTIVSL